MSNDEISRISIAELEEFVSSDLYKDLPVVPISPQRAISQAHNPRAQPKDIVLVLAWSGTTLAGYVGAVPDWFYVGAEKPENLAWLSCMWVSPAQRGKGIAKKLLQEMLLAWNYRVMLTEFTPEVKNLYARTETLIPYNPMEGFRGYLRPNLSQILPPKRKFFQSIKGLLRAADLLLSIPNEIRLDFLKNQALPCKIAYVSSIDSSTHQFIAAHQKGQLACRDRDTLNWMLQYPWVLETPFPDEISARYHFTATARQFKGIALKMTGNEGQLIGVLFFTIRDGHLHVPHAWYSPADIDTVARVIFVHAIRLDAKMLTLYHPDLVQFCKRHSTPFFWSKLVQRHFFVGKTLHQFLANQPLALQDGDGDAGFT